MTATHRIPLSDTVLDPDDLAGQTFLVIDTRELLVTLDGEEEIELGDTVNDIVSRIADDIPQVTWSLVDREIGSTRT
jgi:hypothetical protein